MAQQGQQSSDGLFDLVWIVIGIFVVCYFAWIGGHKLIVTYIFALNVFLGQCIVAFIDDPQLVTDIYTMQTIDPASVSWDQLVYYAEHVGNYVRYPVITVLAALVLILFRSDVTTKYRKTYTMNTLRNQEKVNWPAIIPVIPLDLVNTDIHVGPWAMAMTPMEFARKYQLLKKNDVLLDGAEPGLDMTANIRRGDAKRVFTLQLGPVWESFERCPPHVQALAAVFMARMNRDKKAAQEILNALDKTASSTHALYDIATPVLHKYQNAANVVEIVSKHAYVLTVMASLLNAARDDGVVPTSEFLWLKTIDRRLWYMLNVIGRQTPFAEVGGPFAHWKAESVMGRASRVPMIDEAIKALEVAMKEIKLSPKELQELLP